MCWMVLDEIGERWLGEHGPERIQAAEANRSYFARRECSPNRVLKAAVEETPQEYKGS